MKILKPSHRRKKRYLAVEFLKSRPENPRNWAWRKIHRWLGVWGTSMAHIKIEEKGEKLLISVDRDWVDLVRGALVVGRERFIPLVRVSGTVDALRRKGFL